MKKKKKDFPGGPVVKTPHFQCRGQVFDPWLGNKDPIYHVVQLKKKKTNSIKKMDRRPE